MDEVIIQGTKYISSKRAAKVSGYAKDYVGQLVRKGKLKAVKVGRVWFVDESQLVKFGVSELPETVADVPLLTKAISQTPNRSLHSVSSFHAEVRFPKTWSEIKYVADPEPLYPSLVNRESLILLEQKEELSRSYVSAVPTSARRDTIQYVRGGDGRYVAGFDGIRRVEAALVQAYGPRASSNDALPVPFEHSTPYVGVTQRHFGAELLRTLAAAIIVAAATFFIPLLG